MIQKITSRLFGIALVVTAALTVSAQDANPQRTKMDELRNKIVASALQNRPHSPAKTTATGSRLVAYSMYKYLVGTSAFAAQDSSSYNYASSGNALTTQLITYTNNGTTWVPKTQSAYTYNAAGIVMTEVDQNWNTGSSSYVNTNQIIYTNNTAGYPTDVLYNIWSSGAWTNNMRMTVTYNSSNQQLTELYLQWNTGSSSWTNNYRYTYTRNAAGHVTSTLGEAWSAGSWAPDYKLDSTFNASGGVTTAEFFSWYHSAWSSSGRRLLTVDASNRIVTEINQQFTPPSTYLSQQKTDYTYNAAGDVANRVAENFDFIANDWSTDLVKVVYAYNGYRQCTSASGSVYNSGVWTYDGYSQNQRWYYQTYTITTGGGGGVGIAKVQPQGGVLTLSPVPAQNVLAIDLQLQAAEDLKLEVLNMQGELVQRMVLNDVAGLKRNLSVADMPGGNYLLSVKGSAGTRFTRMFSVVH